MTSMFANHPEHEREMLESAYDAVTMIEAWESSLDFCESQMATIRNREAYLKSIKIIQDQQDALQIIISSVDIEPPPTTEAEIDAA